MTGTLLRFLVVDDNSDARFLLVKALRRTFPGAIIDECQSTASSVEMARSKNLGAIIAHRSTEMAGVELIRKMREQNPKVPIVMVSGIDRKDLALAAGADKFMLYEEWSRLGSVVEELISSTTGTRKPFAPEL
jgi:CheY-like chemotaxis protein